jgi:lipid A 3-O-deacylase
VNKVRLIACLAAFLGLASAASASERYNVYELKYGGLAHDVPFLGGHKEDGADVNLEFLFKSPDFLKIIWSPRPHIGADINTSHNTNVVYAGLTWTIPIVGHLFGRQDGLFVDLSEGPSWNDGIINVKPQFGETRKSLGSNILFRESFSLGYTISPKNDLSIFVDHVSNARLADRNEGITSAGLRIGYKF